LNLENAALVNYLRESFATHYGFARVKRLVYAVTRIEYLVKEKSLGTLSMMIKENMHNECKKSDMLSAQNFSIKIDCH